MTNRILSVQISDVSLVPAEAIVHVNVVPERLDAGTEVRGRLMGPMCRYASTVEVAYPLRPSRRQTDTGRDTLTMRVVIPEASFWTPQTPHLYAGPVELWQDGRRVDVMQVRHGLRRVTLGPSGVLVNGEVLSLRGREVTQLDDAMALALRSARCNYVVAPVGEQSRHVWEVADRIGLFVLGRTKTEPTATDLLRHPSALGWLVGEEMVIVGEFGGRLPVSEENLEKIEKSDLHSR